MGRSGAFGRLAVLYTLVAALLVGMVGASGADPSDWTDVSSWGSDGTGDGEFSFPIGVTIDSLGHIWTAENGGGATCRLQKFDTFGAHLGTFLDGECGLHALDADEAGNIWIGHAGEGALVQVDQDGDRTGLSFRADGDGDDVFQVGCPCGVAIDAASGLLYGSNGPGGLIHVFDTVAGTFVETIDTDGTHVSHLAVDLGTGRLWAIVDEEIHAFDGAKAADATIPGTFGGVDVDAAGNVYGVNATVTVFSPEGVEVSAAPDGTNPGGQDVATDGAGNVYTLAHGDESDVGKGLHYLVYHPATPKCKGKVPTLVGTPGDDVLVGTDGDDVVVAFAGDDEIDTGDGNDTICAGAGNDEVDAGKGDDLVRGDEGDDTINGRAGNDRITGNDGDDFIKAGGGDDIVKGGDGADTVKGQAGVDVVKGQNGDDIVTGGGGDDRVLGGNGADKVRGQGDDDVAKGQNDDDIVAGGGGNDTLRGGRDDDTLRGQKGDDKLFGQKGDDTADGGVGSDLCKAEVETNCES